MCRSLGYPYGVNVAGWRFGHLVESVGVGKMHCTGDETDITLCSMTDTDQCTSGNYASVACDYQPITDSG